MIEKAGRTETVTSTSNAIERKGLASGMHPGGKLPKRPEAQPVRAVVTQKDSDPEGLSPVTPTSIRVLKRGISGVGDQQRFLEALMSDVADGKVEVRKANCLHAIFRTRVGLAVQSQAMQSTLDIMPYESSAEG